MEPREAADAYPMRCCWWLQHYLLPANGPSEYNLCHELDSLFRKLFCPFLSPSSFLSPCSTNKAKPGSRKELVMKRVFSRIPSRWSNEPAFFFCWGTSVFQNCADSKLVTKSLKNFVCVFLGGFKGLKCKQFSIRVIITRSNTKS